MAEHFNPKVFVNCLQDKESYETRLFIWLKGDDVTNTCVNKGLTKIGYGTKVEVTVVKSLSLAK